jgi:hypothetical protein
MFRIFSYTERTQDASGKRSGQKHGTAARHCQPSIDWEHGFLPACACLLSDHGAIHQNELSDWKVICLYIEIGTIKVLTVNPAGGGLKGHP